MDLFVRSLSVLSLGSWRKAPRLVSQWSRYKSPKRPFLTVLVITPSSLRIITPSNRLINTTKTCIYKNRLLKNTQFRCLMNWWGPRTSNNFSKTLRISSKNKTKTINSNSTLLPVLCQTDLPKKSKPKKKISSTFSISCSLLII